MLLVEKGRPKGEIAVATDASSVERFAAEELQQYIRKSSGARLRIQTGHKGKRTKVFVGRAERWGIGEEAGRMAPESFRIIADGEQLHLLGADDRGTLYGVYTFIEDYLGVSWTHYRSEEETVPKRKTLRVPNIVRYEEPFLPVRRMVCGPRGVSKEGRDFISWLAKNKVQTVYGGGDPRDCEKEAQFLIEEAVHKRGMDVCWGGHSFCAWLPPDEHFARHPEYFALVDGKREPVSICTTNPKVAEMVSRNIMRFSKRYPEIRIIGFWPSDDYRWCGCRECEKAEARWTSPINPIALLGSRTRMHTGKYLAFANKVAAMVTKKCPDIRLEIIAYWTTVEPPKELRDALHPNLNLCVALIERQYDRALDRPLTKAQLRTSFVEGVHHSWDKRKYSHYPAMLARWRRLAPGPMYFYEYYTASKGCLGCLFPITRSIRDDSRYYKKAGIDGFGTQGWLDNWASYGLNYWFGPRCAWNGESSHDELLARYCRGYYGSAAAEMQKFHLELADSLCSRRVGLPLRQMVRIFIPTVVGACEGHLAAANKKARGARTRARIARMAVLLRYGALLHRFSELGSAGQLALSGGKLKEFYDLLSQQLSVQSEISDVLRTRDVFPPSCADSIHYFFTGVGAHWVQNPWGLYHTLKLLEPLTKRY